MSEAITDGVAHGCITVANTKRVTTGVDKEGKMYKFPFVVARTMEANKIDRFAAQCTKISVAVEGISVEDVIEALCDTLEAMCTHHAFNADAIRRHHTSGPYWAKKAHAELVPLLTSWEYKAFA